MMGQKLTNTDCFMKKQLEESWGALNLSIT